MSAGAGYRDSQRKSRRAVNPCCGKASLHQPAMQTALNLSRAAADREAGQAPLAAAGTAGGKFPSDNNAALARQNFRLAQSIVMSGGEPCNLCNAKTTVV